MVFIFEQKGVCKISMDGFVEDMLSICEHIAGTVKTPTSNDLFAVNEESPLLSASKR
jgi:hypothetical protein